MMRDQRLSRELQKLAAAPPKGISVTPKADKMHILEAQIIGPEKSPYDTGVFNLEILVPDNYPFAPPSVKFITKVYHPNIDDNGRICLDLIKMPPSGNWRPLIGIESLLVAIRMLLESPNPDDPLMPEIADEYRNNRPEYERKAKEHCTSHANN